MEVFCYTKPTKKLSLWVSWSQGTSWRSRHHQSPPRLAHGPTCGRRKRLGNTLRARYFFFLFFSVGVFFPVGVVFCILFDSNIAVLFVIFILGEKSPTVELCWCCVGWFIACCFLFFWILGRVSCSLELQMPSEKAILISFRGIQCILGSNLETLLQNHPTCLFKTHRKVQHFKPIENPIGKKTFKTLENPEF